MKYTVVEKVKSNEGYTVTATLAKAGETSTTGKTDRIVALSTCDSSQTNGRIILFGKLE